MADTSDKILFAMSLEPCDIPPEVISYYYEEWKTVFPDSECLALHNTVVSLYEWLIRDANKNSSGGGYRKEKVGGVQVEVGEVDKASDWENALESYLDAPWSAFPSCKDELGAGVTGRIIVGGVDESQIESINCNSNIRTGGASEVCGVSQPSAYRYMYKRRGYNWTLGRRCR